MGWCLLVSPSQRDHLSEWRCESEQVFSVHAPACVQWAWPRQMTPPYPPPAPPPTYEPGETRAADTSDGSISATPTVSSSSSSSVSGSSQEPQPLTRPIRSNPCQDWARLVYSGDRRRWHSCCFSSRRSARTLRWQPGWFPLEITESAASDPRWPSAAAPGWLRQSCCSYWEW